jgi:integrase
MSNKAKSGLPSGVSIVANRPGLYRLTCMINGKRYSEYCRPAETGKKKLQSDLQKAVDAFRDKAERGALKGQITDKSKLADAAEWYLNTAKLELRESTLLLAQYTFREYILPALGSLPLRTVTSAVITDFLADLTASGGGYTVYVARPAFVEQVNASIPKGKVMDTAPLIGIAMNTFLRVRKFETVNETNAQKTADYYGVPLDKAFERCEGKSPLKATTTNRINTCLSAMFTALVHHDILQKNPCTHATKPRIGEAERGAFLDNFMLGIFAAALENVADDNTRITLTLLLHLGLRSGEARALRWTDVEFQSMIVSVNHSAGKTSNGLIIGETKTLRSRRKLPLSPFLYSLLLEHQARQAVYAQSIGSLWENNGLIVTTPTGGIMDKETPWREVKRIVKANPALPPDLHPHSLRHSFVSLLISKGLDVVNVAALAGDTVDVISRIYAHSFAERQAAAMDIIGAAFEQALPIKPAPAMLTVHTA